MSYLSGKCDLYDHLSMMKYRDKDGNEVHFGDNVPVYYSDLWECYRLFKHRTDGKLYQHVKVEHIDSYVAPFIKTNCKEFDYIKHEEKVLDKRTKDGYRINTYYTYIYYGKEYSEKEINKKGVYITKTITFDTLLELLPYLPYIVCSSCAINGKEIIYISSNSYVDEHETTCYKNGFSSNMAPYYRKQLAQLYLDVCKRYYTYKLEERTCVEPIDFSNLKKEENYYVMHTQNNIDGEHPLLFIWEDEKSHTHYSSPKLIKDNQVALSIPDVELYLKDKKVSLEYIKETEFPLYLD